MAAYKSILTYDGTDFHGFQRQAHGQRTIQGVFERALRALGWTQTSLQFAGRTDAGVHALGQVVAYHLDWKHDPERLTQALNAHLPGDVAVRHTEEAQEGFHPRFSARGRRYRYRLLIASARDPLRERFAWRVWPEPDFSATAGAAQLLVGRRDFGAFGRALSPGGHTVREVVGATWEREDDTWAFIIEADAFLYRMVRRLVAATWEIGQGRRSASDLQAHLADPTKFWIGRVAPARGLCLEAVIYGDGG